MNIGIILPGLSLEYNSIGFMILELEKYGYNPTVITSRSRGLKDKGVNPEFEEHGRTKIYRIVDKSPEIWGAGGTEVENRICDILEANNVSLICTCTNASYRIGRLLGKRLNVPNILMLEFVFHKRRFFSASKREFLGLPFLIPLAWRYNYNKFRRGFTALSSFYVEEQPQVDSTKNVFLVPWCNDIRGLNPSGIDKENSLIFAGELTKWTIKVEMITALDKALSNGLIDKVHFVGYGDKKYLIDGLKSKYKEEVIIHGSLPRQKVLELIKKAKYGLQPATLGGWGFMGECLALGTPLITLKSNRYKLSDGVNVILLEELSNLSKALSYYNTNDKAYRCLQENGLVHYRLNHTAEITGKFFADMLDEVVLDHSNLEGKRHI